jgi:succinyl-diaminopimelate desuccinylase
MRAFGSDDGFHVVLNGHVDVVPVGNLSGWDFDPFGAEVFDGKIHGRGASDMKCGLAVLLFSMALLNESGANLKGDIRLHVATDEEIAGDRHQVVLRPWLCGWCGCRDGGGAHRA